VWWAFLFCVTFNACDGDLSLSRELFRYGDRGDYTLFRGAIWGLRLIDEANQPAILIKPDGGPRRRAILISAG
jgi:hypothetical protein